MAARSTLCPPSSICWAVCRNMEGESEEKLYGEDRLISAARSATEVRSSRQFCGDLLADVDFFAAGAEQADDITMLAFKLNGIQRTFDASQEGIHGGLGIYMVKKLSKSVSCARIEDRNVLTVSVAI